MKGHILALFGVTAVSIFYACGSLDYGKEKPTEILVQADEPDAQEAWLRDVSQIMQYKCANCHGPNHHKFAPEKAYKEYPYNFEDKDTFTKLAPLIKLVIFDEAHRKAKPASAMPPDYATPLTELEKTAIKNYIEKKLPTVATTPTPPVGTPDPNTPASTVKFADVESILVASCGSCHGPSGNYKAIYDTSTQAAAASKAANSAARMQDSAAPMPQAGRIDSTPDGKKLLEWFKAGAP